ncbi:MAG: DUF6878 family protein [Planctomycetota bacterium]
MTTTPLPAYQPPDYDALFRDACHDVFALMERHRLDVLDAEYNGGGDSGQIDNVTGYTLPEGVTPPDHIEADPNDRDDWLATSPGSTVLYDAADRALSCFDPILGWENNEGAYGVLTFDRLHRRVIVSHDWYITTTENAQFEREVTP